MTGMSGMPLEGLVRHTDGILEDLLPSMRRISFLE